MDISYIINHLGEDRENYFNSVTPPIYQNVMYTFQNTSEMRERIQLESEIPFYTRGLNPTGDILRKKIAALEKAEDALVFASGVTAISAGVLANVQTGDHIICVQKPYAWTNRLMTEWLPRFGVEVSMVNGVDLENFQSVLQKNTKLIFSESPNSWTFEQQDLEAIANFAKENKLLTIVDNSFASPLYQNPIELGIDMVAHSATKYINGHSDALAGVLCGTKEMMQKVFKSEYMTLGGMLSPFHSWLLLRGLRTLPIRLKQVGETTTQIVSFLENHPKVLKVYYPFSNNEPQKELTKKQLKSPTGQFSIEIKANSIEEVETFCDTLQRFLLAVSWGGYESLVFPACILYQNEQETQSLPWNMVRFGIGLEEPEVLIKDLEQAFSQI